MPVQHIAEGQPAAEDVQGAADGDMHTPGACLLHEFQILLQA